MDLNKNNSNIITMKIKDGRMVKMPVEGSLGLLAVGHRGLIAWREAIKASNLKKEGSYEKK